MRRNYLLLLLTLMLQVVYAQEKLNIFDVARKGTVEQAKILLQSDPKIFNTINEEGYSPLILACYRGNNDVAKLIIDNGADINGSSSMGTPLMAAVVKGNTEIVHILLGRHADPNIADPNGTTALIYATMFKNKEIIKMLLDHKADKTKVDKQGKTAFEYAVFSNNDEIINLLK